MSYRNGRLKCDMHNECGAQVTHFDEKGFAYCRDHGIARKSPHRCRQLSTGERKALEAGAAIYYEPARNTAAFLATAISKARGETL
jgi:hypothetical protein